MKSCITCQQQRPEYEFNIRARKGTDNPLRYNECAECELDRKKHERHVRVTKQREAGTYTVTQERRWEAGLKTRYGLNADGFYRLFETQGGVCAVCGSDDPRGKNWVVDHDHSCCPGKKTCGLCIRGILCSPCNSAIGMLYDSPAVLRTAANYLENNNG